MARTWKRWRSRALCSRWWFPWLPAFLGPTSGHRPHNRESETQAAARLPGGRFRFTWTARSTRSSTASWTGHSVRSTQRYSPPSQTAYDAGGMATRKRSTSGPYPRRTHGQSACLLRIDILISTRLASSQWTRAWRHAFPFLFTTRCPIRQKVPWENQWKLLRVVGFRNNRVEVK